jgi:LytS/YehU family sensor histidine kinase
VRELDANWIETRNLQIPLSALEPGNYTLEIAALNSLGQAGAVTLRKITILTPWFSSWWFLSLMTLAVLLTIAYYYKLARDRVVLGKNLALMRLSILRTQMNPHFVFNSLSNIQRLVHAGELKDANTYIVTLASIMRKSIDYSDKEFIQLDKELEYTRSYLEIEKLRFGDKFDYEIVCSLDADEAASVFVPPLLLQPLVENTVKHAFKRINYMGSLKLHIDKKNEFILRYIVQDNGCGFDVAKTSREYGLGIAKERIELLYKHTQKKGSFTVDSRTGPVDSGTTIVIELPILKD